VLMQALAVVLLMGLAVVHVQVPCRMASS